MSTDYDDRAKQSLHCPQCSKSAIYFPHRFRPPKKTDNDKWAVVKYLYENGFSYQHISNRENSGYVNYPESMADAREFVERYKR